MRKKNADMLIVLVVFYVKVQYFKSLLGTDGESFKVNFFWTWSEFHISFWFWSMVQVSDIIKLRDAPAQTSFGG